MDLQCDLKFEVEDDQYQENEEDQHIGSLIQDDQNIGSSIKTRKNEIKYRVSSKMKLYFSNNFVDVLNVKKEKEKETEALEIGNTLIRNEPVASENFMDSTYIRTEDESDPLAIDNTSVKIATTTLNYLTEDVITPKDVTNSLKQYPWQCIFCNRWPFHGYKYLYEHIQTEHKETSLKDFYCRCNDCEKEFPCYSIFLNHVRFNHRNNWKLCCDICDEFFEDYKQLAKHRTMHTNMKDTIHPIVYLCFKCGRAYSKETELQNHIKFSHCYICYICKVACDSSLELKNHLESLHNLVNINCVRNFQDLNFNKRRKVQRIETVLQESNISEKHKKIHQRELKCRFCPNVFTTQKKLNTHLTTHFKSARFRCDFCKRLFFTKNEKLHHELIHKKNGSQHKKQKKRKPSEEILSTQKNSKKHRSFHETYSRYKCELCSKNFRFLCMDHLSKHFEYPVACLNCAKGLSKQMYIKKYCRSIPSKETTEDEKRG